jgi:AcrR family transcriptional regulator
MMDKMNMSSTPDPRRPYRMRLRAEAAAATAERLLAAAWANFASRPYEDVRLAEIAAEAGVTVQTLHNRFVSKDELFAGAYAWFGGQEIAEREEAPIGDVREAVAVLFRRYETHGDSIARMIAQEDRIEAIRQMTEAGRAYHRSWVERTFEPQLGELDGAERERRVVAMVVASDLVVWRLLRREIGLKQDEAEAVVVEMLLGARPGVGRGR